MPQTDLFRKWAECEDMSQEMGVEGGVSGGPGKLWTRTRVGDRKKGKAF